MTNSLPTMKKQKHSKNPRNLTQTATTPTMTMMMTTTKMNTIQKTLHQCPYLIIVTDATDAVSVNFSGRCKFLLIYSEKLAFFTDLTRKIGVFRCKFYFPKTLPV